MEGPPAPFEPDPVSAEAAASAQEPELPLGTQPPP
jgi:hypothetical protein